MGCPLRPNWLKTRYPLIFTLLVMPAIPSPFPIVPAMMLDTRVPCPFWSSGSGSRSYQSYPQRSSIKPFPSSSIPLKPFADSLVLAWIEATRSGWSNVTPESITPTMSGDFGL